MNNTTSDLKTTLEAANGTTLVLPDGRLDYQAAESFQAMLEQAIRGDGAKPRALVVDCSNRQYVSSAGLRAFLVGARAASTDGVPFAVCGLTPAVSEVFEVSGFNRLIKEYPDRAAALSNVVAQGG